MKVCFDCKGTNIHRIELTDYSRTRHLHPVNKETKEIYDDDLPCHLDGYYCHDCEGFCSIIELKEE